MWQLCPHNQHQKDRGGLSASTWQALQGAHHYSEISKTASSPTLEAHCQESCTLMMKSMSGLPKLVQHLADYLVVFGIKVESGLTQSWKSTELWCCQHCCMHAKRGQFTNGTPKDWTTSIQAVLENFYKLSGKTGFQTRKSWKGQGCRVYILFWNWHS